MDLEAERRGLARAVTLHLFKKGYKAETTAVREL